MPNFSIKTIWANTTLDECDKARAVYLNLRTIEREAFFAIPILYLIGIAEGKRIERARRKGNAQARAAMRQESVR